MSKEGRKTEIAFLLKWSQRPLKKPEICVSDATKKG